MTNDRVTPISTNKIRIKTAYFWWSCSRLLAFNHKWFWSHKQAATYLWQGLWTSISSLGGSWKETIKLIIINPAPQIQHISITTDKKRKVTCLRCTSDWDRVQRGLREAGGTAGRQERGTVAHWSLGLRPPWLPNPPHEGPKSPPAWLLNGEKWLGGCWVLSNLASLYILGRLGEEAGRGGFQAEG